MCRPFLLPSVARIGGRISPLTHHITPPLQMVGASVGAETADRWAKLGMLRRMWPYQSGKNIANGINTGEIHFKDIHLRCVPIVDVLYGSGLAS